MAMKTPKKKHYRPAGKKKEGNAARYITRSQAIRQLGVSLKDFRRLCILKGVFPREPKKKVRGNNKTYYHLKDIAFLRHEPLLEKFREIWSYKKKILKAEKKKEFELAESLQTRLPTYRLDRLVRERYPKFLDALRDLDDCLTMVHLFAALPAEERLNIDVGRVHACRRLSHEWQAFVSRTHKLRKVFVSVKGIYYQAEVEGQKIIWLTPHQLQQVLPDDINFPVMLTFLEFYETLLGFVNFRLYHSINVKYPPVLDARLEALAAELYELSRYIDFKSRASSSSALEEVEAQIQETQLDESEVRLAQLQHQLPSNEPGALMQQLTEDADEDDQETKECANLFKDMKFFLSREVPRESMLFVIPAFGGVVSWDGDGAPFKETDDSITHQIVDRPSQGHRYLSREYVQPQWIYDCINARIMLPTENYLVGRIPPPHLSPFVDNETEGYVPDYAETIKRLQAAARKEVLPLPGVGEENLNDPQNLLVESYVNRTEAAEATEKKRKLEAYEKQYHDELKRELEGADHSSAAQETIKESLVEDPESENESEQPAQDMSDIMLSRKKRKLLDAMKKGNDRKKAAANKLKQRKKQLEAEKSTKS